MIENASLRAVGLNSENNLIFAKIIKKYRKEGIFYYKFKLILSLFFLRIYTLITKINAFEPIFNK